MIEVEVASPRLPEVQPLLDALSDTLQAITGDSGRNSFDPRDVEQEGALFVIARNPGSEPVGCGALRPLQPGVAEVKRMFAVSGSKGVGQAILEFLEHAGRRAGYREFWLETRGVNRRAVDFYLRHGYRQIENFGKYAGRAEAVCFAKQLTP